jgi:nickel-type superoxide dismutase maturation protease
LFSNRRLFAGVAVLLYDDVMASDELEEISLKEFMLWLLRRRHRFRITGNSMMPLLRPGDEVLLNPRAYRLAQPQPGDIVVAYHPYQRDLQVVKRVTQTLEDGRYFLEGENPAESSDSRLFGPVRPEQILGQITCRFG